jgi:membrane protease YdiL (CAAX protease family)
MSAQIPRDRGEIRWWELLVVPVGASLGWLIVFCTSGVILGFLFAAIGYGAQVKAFVANPSLNFFLIYINAAIFYLAMLLAVRRDLGKRHGTTPFARYFRSIGIRALVNAGFSGLALAGIYVVVIVGVSWSGLWHPQCPTGRLAWQPTSLGQLAISGLVAVVLAPLAEEMYFRGLLLDWLQQKLAPLLSALLSAVLFSLVHFLYLICPGMEGWMPTAAIAGLGLLNAVWVQRTHSLRAPVAVHATYNATLMLVAFFDS